MLQLPPYGISINDEYRIDWKFTLRRSRIHFIQLNSLKWLTILGRNVILLHVYLINSAICMVIIIMHLCVLPQWQHHLHRDFEIRKNRTASEFNLRGLCNFMKCVFINGFFFRKFWIEQLNSISTLIYHGCDKHHSSVCMRFKLTQVLRCSL